MVGCHRHLPWPRVVQEGEGDAVLCAQLLPHDDLVDVVELVPVLILIVHVSIQRLELRTSWDGHVQGLGCEEGLLLEKIEVVPVHQIGKELIREPVQDCLLCQTQPPLPVALAIHLLRIQQGQGVVEPIDHRFIFCWVQLHLDCLQGLDIQHVIAIIQRRLLIIEGREAHSLEVSSVSLLSSHHDPHGSPLGHVDRLNDLVHLCAKGDGTTAVVHGLAV
mmetsp:Transcript_38034/g.88957  ORF Transcript_38034/g.88957 Transcript_38034/m.88957 type:complete len:219 (-) Transcript_38034:572-1228(-)